MNKCYPLSAILVFLLWMISFSIFAATLKVPSQFPTLKSAVENSASGDTILVAPGTYHINYENRVEINNSLYILAERPGETTEFVSNGNSILIRYEGELTIEGLEFKGASSTFGAGVVCYGNEQLIINNCQFENCSRGVNIKHRAEFHISNCRFTLNSIGLRLEDSNFGNPTIENSIFTYNHAYAISCSEDGPIITNCSFFSNNKTFNADNLTIKNSIIFGYGSETTPFTYVPNYSATYSCFETAIPGIGNISDDPIFRNPLDGDLRLHPASPCINAGDPNDDFSKEPIPNGGRINMGAFGNTSMAVSKSPTTAIVRYEMEGDCVDNTDIILYGLNFGNLQSIKVGDWVVPPNDVLIYSDTYIQFECPNEKVDGSTIILNTTNGTDSLRGNYILSPNVEYVSGDVSGTWTNECPSTYILTHSVRVQEGETLTIEPGVKVYVDLDSFDFTNFYVEGKLEAIGTADEKIIFAVLPTQKNQGKWSGITVLPDDDDQISELNHCIIEGAYTGLYLRARAVGCTSYDNYTIVKNCIIRNNNEGIIGNAYGSSTSGCIPFSQAASCSPRIEGNDIYNNEVGINLRASSGYFSYGNNYASCLNNKIYRNSVTGVLCEGESRVNAKLINNIIIENPVGIEFGERFDSTSFLIQNNIIGKNNLAILSRDSLNTTIQANLLWENNSDYLGFAKNPVANIYGNPLFKNYENNDWQVLANSPCIDAGINYKYLDHDVKGNSRPLDGNGDLDSLFDIGIHEYQLPTILDQSLGNIALCEGETVNLFVTVEGNSLQYQWQKNGIDITGETSSTLSLQSVTLQDQGAYQCLVWDDLGGQVNSNNIMIEISSLVSPDISISTITTEACEGEEITLVASPMEGGSSPNYEWFLNNQPTGHTTPVWNYSGGEGTFSIQCKMVSSLTCATRDTVSSNIISITFFPLPEVEISGSLTFCEGNSTILTASGSDTYSWNTGQQQNEIEVLDAGTYTVTGTDQNGCMGENSVQVEINPNPDVTLTLPRDSFCINEPGIQLSGGNPSGGTYEGPGISGGILNPNFAGSGLHTVTYSFTDQNGCVGEAETVIKVSSQITPGVTISSMISEACEGEEIILVASPFAGGPNPEFQWYIDNQPAGVTSPVFKYNGVFGTHSIHCTMVTSLPCNTQEMASSNNLTITIHPKPNIDIKGELSFCEGESTTLTASGGTSYEWSTGATSSNITVNTAGDYSVTVIDGNGCSSSETVSVVQNPLPTAEISGVLEFCEGESTTITASGGTTYEWNTGETSSSITITSPGNYSVTVTDDNSCENSTSKAVVELPLPNVSFVLNHNDSICVNDPAVKLMGGTPIGGSYSGPGITNGFFDPNTAGIGSHSITYTYQDPSTGCSNRATKNIIVIGGDCLTALSSITDEFSVIVFPNPSDGIFTVQFENWKDLKSIHLFDSQGRIIYTNETMAGLIQINGIPRGSYFLKVISDEKVAVKEILVQ